MLRLKKTYFILIIALGFKAWGYEVILSSNAEVAQAWNRQLAAQTGTKASKGGAAKATVEVPVLKEEADGTYTVEWTNDISAHVYTNDVKNASGITNTPDKTGTFYRAEYQTDVRKTYENEDVNFFQFGLTHSKDPAVLSATQNQINNLQFGRSTDDYYVSGGDVAPKFSSLSSALAARGIIGQKSFSDYLITAYAGLVADSWEAVGNSVPRSQFLRNAFGAKLEKEFFTGLTLYVTDQEAGDQTNSITDPTIAPGTVNAKSLHTSTLGFEYKVESSNFQIAGEVATSNATVQTVPSTTGKAGIVDASWSIGDVSLQGGYHDIDQTYNSLSAQALPGVKESSLGADWRATNWMRLGGSARKSRTTAAAVGLIAAQDQETAAGNVNARFTINPEWSLSLQRNNSDTDDNIAITKSKNAQDVAGIKYKGAVWLAAVNASKEELRNENAPTLNADTSKTKLSVGRSFGGGDNATWLLDVTMDYSVQDQKLLTSGNTVTTTKSLVMASQFLDIVNIDVSASQSSLIRPNTQPELTSFNHEVAASRDFQKKGKARLYYRNSELNKGDATLFVAEQVTGAQYSFSF